MSDEDSGTNGQVTFEVVKESQGPYFDIRQVGDNMGELYSLDSFDNMNRLPGAVIIDGEVKYKGELNYAGMSCNYMF